MARQSARSDTDLLLDAQRGEAMGGAVWRRNEVDARTGRPPRTVHSRAREDDFVMDDFFVIGVIERMRAALTPTAPYDGAARAGDAP
jgi:hypothetical protein